MLANSWSDRLIIRSIIFALQSIAPVCVAFTALLLTQCVRARSWPQWSPFRIYCVAETLFAFVFRVQRARLQRKAIHPPLRSNTQRKELIKRVSNEVHDKEKFISGWFRGARVGDIHREDVRVFLDWAFWEGRAHPQMDKHELEEYVQVVEDLVERKFPPGHGNARGLRISVDPIEMDGRSLAWYSLIMLADTVNHIKMLNSGFRYHGTTTTNLHIFPPRPAAYLTTGRSKAAGLSYWLRPHTSKSRLPILYIHGIGIGLLTHANFLCELKQALDASADGDEADGHVGILALEILPISSRLTHSMLRRAEFIKQVLQILDGHGLDRVVLAAHSYGTILSTHLLNDDAAASRIAATLLIDPVCILLHMPDVAYNFTVRPPKTAGEWQLWYFASKDPGIAHTLGRHLFWSESLFWRDRITALCASGMKMTISLAEIDLIVDTPAVEAYLRNHKLPDPVVKPDEGDGEHIRLQAQLEKDKDQKTQSWSKDGLDLMWWDGLDHAQVYDHMSTRARLVDVIVRYTALR